MTRYMAWAAIGCAGALAVGCAPTVKSTVRTAQVRVVTDQNDAEIEVEEVSHASPSSAPAWGGGGIGVTRAVDESKAREKKGYSDESGAPVAEGSDHPARVIGKGTAVFKHNYRQDDTGPGTPNYAGFGIMTGLGLGGALAGYLIMKPVISGEKEMDSANFLVGMPVGLVGVSVALSGAIVLAAMASADHTYSVHDNVVKVRAHKKGYETAEMDVRVDDKREVFFKLKPKDSDNDGIADLDDACPRVAGQAEYKGCGAPEVRTPPPVAAAPPPPPPPPAHAAPPEFVPGSPQPATYVLAIGIETYRDVNAPIGAAGDAQAFSRLVRATLGVPEANLKLELNDRASRGDIEKGIAWLSQNVPAGGRIVFYFSGHGAPDPSSGTAYLLPYDGDPAFLDRTALKLSDVVASLSSTRARDVVVMLDSCFSGRGERSVLPKGARPLVRSKEVAPPSRIAIFSASSGEQIAGPVPNGTAGLFTSHILAALGKGEADGNGDGQITLGELQSWVAPRVERDARQANRDQRPSLVLGKDISGADAVVMASGVKSK